ncbi:cysteine desulfurase-like protein [Roseibacterium sp. SDUM158017]|uniref:cysteine desulfurase-like protein n=1 Tax=Roseicyclus salinarum TaxID=3036773 RepID=UPI0024154A07|nr:cysteine desulfurase-like protein [Roseibacterium sp. SDUM158017]MDG4650417.1 cysteine desulfurase-like protein [Roseibacterium sp. SDUM158017]
MALLDMNFVRGNFPALGQEQVFLDNAGGSQVARQVADRLTEYLLSSNVQLGASYAASARAGGMVHAGRQALATLVNAARPEEIVMGATSTQLFDQLARALVQTWTPGDEVIVTNFDHEANIGPWRKLEAQGIVIREWTLPAGGAHMPDLDDLQDLLSDRTRLVAVTHASNIFGSIMPIATIADLVHSSGALLCVDGVAYAPHRAIDVQALGADFYGFSVYKTYGAHFAALYGRHDHLLAAGNINHAFFARDKVPQKMEPGNASYELAYSCIGVVDYLEALAQAHGINARGREAVEAAFRLIAEHEEMLSRKLLDYLSARPDVTIVGDPSADKSLRVPTISFTVEGVSSRQVVEAVDPTGIGIRYGDFYSRRLIESLGLQDCDGVIRVSAVHYNTEEEFDRLIARLEEIRETETEAAS